jgi:cytoskeletal protein RodZ
MASFGENLRRERELRGVSLREIAEATKISIRFLAALEEDRVDRLPGGLFPRAFLRQYTRYLGLDAERYVAEFLYVNDDPAPASPPPAPRERRPPLPRGLFLFGAVVVVGIVLTLKLGGVPERAVEDAAPLAGGPAVAVPPSPATQAPYPSSPTLASAASSTTDGLVLTLRAQQDCWVEARADGETVLNRVLAGGETATLEAHGRIVLSVGNAGGLDFRVNDLPGMPLGKSGEVKRNIVITRDNIPSLVQEDASSVQASHSS